MSPDQTTPVGAVLSGSTMFASMLMLNSVILLAFERLKNVLCVYTEVLAQDDTVSFG